jgi:RimJ/RimL family protein N-acetyltransferase
VTTIDLYRTDAITLTEIRPEIDAAIESTWTRDLNYVVASRFDPRRPYLPAELKRKYVELSKQAGRDGKRFDFAIRTRPDDRLIGFLSFPVLYWNNHEARIAVSFGQQADECLYGRDALWLGCQYGFRELNLHRLSAWVGGFLTTRIELFQSAGFQVEVRRRNTIYHRGQYFDWVLLGQLEDEWSEGNRI